MMNENWIASKSMLVKKVRNAPNEEERLKLQPDNVKSLHDWKDFVKEKTSKEFKVKSEKFKDMRKKQLELQHTMSRKGYSRLTIDLKEKTKMDYIIRAVVWMNGHRKKNGEPSNTKIAKNIDDMEEIESNGNNSTNLKEYAFSKVFGAERNGRVRIFGKGVTRTRLDLASQMNYQFAHLREENAQLKSHMSHMQHTIDELVKNQVPNPRTTEVTPITPIVSSAVKSPPQNIIQNSKCKLLDWTGIEDIVAEGRWASSDPHSLVHFVELGPNAMKVWVDVSKKPETFLWRPTSNLTNIEEVVGTAIAWPAD